MDHLFNRLDGMYPNKWRASFQNAQAVENWRQAWADAFTGEGITFEDIKHGLNVCLRTFDWPPSLPEFLRACRPPVEPEAAYHEAVEQMARRKSNQDTWSHPAIFWAAAKIGHFDLEQSSWKTLKTRWTAELNHQLAAGEWAEIPPYALALPAPGRTSTTIDEGRQKISEIAAEQYRRMRMHTELGEP